MSAESYLYPTHCNRFRTGWRSPSSALFRKPDFCTIGSMLAAAAPWARIARCAPLCALLLAAMAATGCGSRNVEPVRLNFSLNSSLAAGCNGIPEPGQLRFYVSNLRLVEANGAAAPVMLNAEPTQSGDAGIALVSWDGQCAGAQDNPRISGEVTGGDYAAVHFELGVPFERNHDNPLAAPPPLNVPTMFWTWQSGYKFLRLDVGTDWSFHLGSTGCVSASAVRPAESCARPNRATIRLPAAVAWNGTVVVDLDALLAGIDPGAAANCVDDFHAAAHCRRLLSRIGIDVDNGQCEGGCRHQALFRYEDGAE